jgi:hypothetical protein
VVVDIALHVQFVSCTVAAGVDAVATNIVGDIAAASIADAARTHTTNSTMPVFFLILSNTSLN